MPKIEKNLLQYPLKQANFPNLQNDELSQSSNSFSSNIRDMTSERILEADQLVESKCGDNAIPYLRVGPSSMVPQEYKVSPNLNIN